MCTYICLPREMMMLLQSCLGAHADLCASLSPGETWKTARLQGSSIQHILQPMDFTVQLAKCMVDNDARMARYTGSGQRYILVVASHFYVQWFIH